MWCLRRVGIDKERENPFLQGPSDPMSVSGLRRTPGKFGSAHWASPARYHRHCHYLNEPSVIGQNPCVLLSEPFLLVASNPLGQAHLAFPWVTAFLSPPLTDSCVMSFCQLLRVATHVPPRTWGSLGLWQWWHKQRLCPNSWVCLLGSTQFKVAEIIALYQILSQFIRSQSLLKMRR